MTLPPIVNRTKLVVATHGTAIAVALVVVGLLAFGGAAWTVTHPPTVEVTEQVNTHTVGTDVETSTVVTGNTSLWERGTTLEDKPLYPLKSAPRLTVTIHTSVPMGQEVQVSQELSLVYRASKDDAVFWEADRVLVAEEGTVTTGQTSSSATFDVQAVRTHLDEINAEIAGIGQAQAYLRLNVTYHTDEFSGSLSKTAPMAVLSTGYWVGGSLDGENTHQTPVTREVTEPPETGKALGLGLLGFISMGGAGGVVYLSSRRLDPDAITAELDEQRYREWVSAGRLGQFVSGQDVAMDSLKDLVDVAIDSNNRVVHDRQRELYAVVDADVIYYYDPHHPEPEIDFEPVIEPPLQSDGGQSSPFQKGARPSPGPTPAHSGGASPAAAYAGSPEAGAEPDELPAETASVTRTLAREGGRLVATYRLTADAPGPVTVDIADRLPAECDRVDGLRPLAGAEPSDTFGVEGGVGFRVLVPADGGREVKYVVRTHEPVTDATVAGVGDTGGPRVRRVVALDPSGDR